MTDFDVNSLSGTWMITFSLCAPYGSAVMNKLGLRSGMMMMVMTISL